MRNVRTSGKGRVTPGPSLFSLRALGVAASLVVLSVLATARFLFATISADTAGPTAHVALDAIAFATVCVLFGGIPSKRAFRGVRWADGAIVWLAVLCAGVVSPLIVAANRHTDAPAGSVVAFWTMVIAGFALAAAAAVFRGRGWHLPAAALLGTVAAAATLASWERPSSFSLLTRFTAEQIAMGAASLLWAGGIVVLAHAAASRDIRATLSLCSLPLLALGIALAISIGPDSLASAASPSALLSSAAWGLMCVGFVWVFALSPRVAALPLLWVPAVVTALTLVERAVGMFGPRPVLVSDVALSILPLLGATAVLSIASLDGVTVERGDRADRAGLALLVVSVAGLLAAIVGMLAPGVSVAVNGMRTSGAEFSAVFSFRGFETVGGWIAVSSALLVSVVLASRRAGHRSVALLSTAAGASILAFVAWLGLKATPLHTWVSWIPADVQQDYGTEYASIVFSRLDVPWQLVGVVGTTLAAVVTLVLALVAPRAGGSTAEEIDRVSEGGGAR